MTRPSAVSRNDYVGTNITGPYPYTFPVQAVTDLRVVKRSAATGVETVLAYPTDFSTTDVFPVASGSITLTAALATGDLLTIRRVPARTQDTSFRSLGAFFPEIHENSFDHVVELIQYLYDAIARSPRFPETYDPATLPALTVQPIAGRLLAFNSSASGIEAVAPSAASSASALLSTFAPAGTGQDDTTVQAKLRERVSIFDFLPPTTVGYILAGNTASQTASVIRQAIYDAAQHLWTTYGGGEIFFPRGKYLVQDVELGINETHISLVGESPATYAGMGAGTGIGASRATQLYCPNTNSAKWCIWIHYRGSKFSAPGHIQLRNMQIESDGTTDAAGVGSGVEYGVVITTSVASLDHVTIANFQHNLAGFGWNSNVFNRCSFAAASRVGVALLTATAAAIAYQAPTLSAQATLVAEEFITNSTFQFVRCRFRSNIIGMVLRDAWEGTIIDPVFEGNYRHAIVMWDSRHVQFVRPYLENNNRQNPTYVYTDMNGFVALKSSASLYLNGSVSGAYAAADVGRDILMGETTESSSSVIASDHLTRWNQFDHMAWVKGFGTTTAIRVRSGYENWFLQMQIKEEGNLVYSATASSIRTAFVLPRYYLYGAPNFNVIDHTLGTKTLISFGSWTPTLTTDTPGGTITYLIQTGRFSLDVYSRTVTVHFDIKVNANSLSGSGVLRIAGLPYTSGEEGGGALAYFETMLTNWIVISATIGAGGSTFALYGRASAGTSMTALARTDITANTRIQGSITYQLQKDA